MVLASVMILLAACGGQQAAQSPGGILTVVRVEELRPDGSWAPVASAKLQYQIFGTHEFVSNVALYQEYGDVTDANGYSVALRGPEGEAPGQVGSVFVDVVHPDGRTTFGRQETNESFDFMAWFEGVLPQPAAAANLVRAVCATAIEFPRCAIALEKAGMRHWGTGILVRIR